MSNDLLQKLMATQSDEERSWIVTENLLESLPEDVARALWAVAIPHWFDADILAALCPELSDQAEELYRQLQELSCVEVFEGRGYNVHELTRNQLLDHLWQDNPEYFRSLSVNASEYFANDDKLESQIEWIYHLVIANPETGRKELLKVAGRWHLDYRRSELDSLINILLQHIEANRITEGVKADLLHWEGRVKSRLCLMKEALARYDEAIILYNEIGDQLGEANTLLEIGHVFQFLNFHEEALDRYAMALFIYHENDALLGMANTLIAIGSVLFFFESHIEALEKYKAALSFCREVNYRLGEANTLLAIGKVLQFLDHFTEALDNYRESLIIYREINSRLGEANALNGIGDVFMACDRYTEASHSYETALAIYREIHDHLGEANSLQSIAELQEDLLIGLEYSQAALDIYTQIDNKFCQAQNLLAVTSEIQLKLGQKAEAISSLFRAAELAKEINYERIVNDANQKIAEITLNTRPGGEDGR